MKTQLRACPPCEETAPRVSRPRIALAVKKIMSKRRSSLRNFFFSWIVASLVTSRILVSIKGSFLTPHANDAVMYLVVRSNKEKVQGDVKVGLTPGRRRQQQTTSR